MVLEGEAAGHAVTEAKKTEVWCKDGREDHEDCLEEEKTELEDERKRESGSECPDVKVSNGGCPFSFLTTKKMVYEDSNTRETQVGCVEEETTEYGHEKEREADLEYPVEKVSNARCPFSILFGKKTEYEDENEGETQLEYSEVEKTEYGHDRKWETAINHSETNGTNEGYPLTCPSFIITSTHVPARLNAPSPRLAELLEGADIPGDSGHPPEPPDWLDRDLFNEGRKFYKKYLFCMTFSELLALVLGLAQGPVLKALIHTGRSDTPVKARRRYLSTLFHLMSWFNGDVWDTSDPAHRDLMSIRTTHRRLGLTFNQSTEYDKVLSASVEGRGHKKPARSLLPGLKKDLRAAGVTEFKKKRKVEEEEEYPVVISHGKEKEEKEEAYEVLTAQEKKEDKKEGTYQPQEKEVKRCQDGTKRMHTRSLENEEDFPVIISQLDMSLTQYSFMGLVLAHPTKLGAGAATRREMESLIHFWRGLGWLLGVEDRYNFCAGTLEETKDLCLEVEREIFLPGLAEANFNYEHMVSSLISGMSAFLPISFPAMLRYLGHTLDIPMPAVALSLSWHESLQYWLMRFTYGLIYYAPICLLRFNWWFKELIARVKEQDKANLAAYRKMQAALTVPLKEKSGGGGGGDR